MAKLVLLFSLSSLLAFYIVFSYPSCTIVCLLVCVFFCFLGLYMWLFDCLIFCNRFVDRFIVFLTNDCHIYILCFGRFLPMLCPRLLWAFAALLVFYCSRCLCLLCFCLLLPFVGCLCSFDVSVTNSIAPFFWVFCLRLVYLWPCFAVSFTHLVSFLPFHDFNTLLESIAAPTSHLLLPLIVLAHNNYLCEHCACFDLPILCKACPLRTF